MLYSRRSVLKHTGLLALGATVVTPTLALGQAAARTGIARPLFPDGYPDRKGIIQAAIDAAMANGASYADARLSHVERLFAFGRGNSKAENMAFGVRVLYQGYWGFAASPIWSTEEATRLGTAAIAQAKANVLGRTRITELAPIVDVRSGHWETPVKYDPFTIHPDELQDFFGGWGDFIGKLKFVASSSGSILFEKTNKAFGSSLDQFTTQVLYASGGTRGFGLADRNRHASAGGDVEDISPAGQGFEYFKDRPIREYTRIAHEEAERDLDLPLQPVDPGKYNVLIDQSGIASLLRPSIGVATEIDRIFGFEANAGGTSYINEPETMLGSFKVGSSLLNVTCDRSQPGSVGRVQWDDEGVTPIPYTLVRDGILVNLQTNREGASWIRDHYERSGQELRSFASAGAPTALDAQLVHQGDLSLTPSNTSTSRDDLRRSLGDGIEWRVPYVSMDFQQATGVMMYGRAYKIKNGKRVARLVNAGILFRASELWSNMTAVGGPDSVKYHGVESAKGQPAQQMHSAVYTPPATFKEMTVIDVKRKA